MPQNTPPPTVTDFHETDSNGIVRHLMQLSGILRSVFIPQGFFDIRQGEDEPDAPPLNRLRIYERLGGLLSKTNAGAIRMVSAGSTRLVSMPSQGGFIDAASPDDGKQTARTYEGLGALFLEGVQTLPTGGPGDPGVEEDGNGGLTRFIVLRGDDTLTGANAPRFTLAIPFPEDFIAWGDDGIRWWTRLTAASGPGGSIDPTIEVFDPLTGASFGTAMTDTRNVDDTDAPEAAYVALQITKAQLDAESERWEAAKGLGLLAFECSLPAASSGPGEFYDFNLGAIDIDWLHG